MQWTYLLLDILCIAGPLALSFDKKVAFYKKWRFVGWSIFAASSLFIIWDIIFTKLGIWKFNPDYVYPFRIGGLPFEEILFFVVVPYASVFIYECLKVYFPNMERKWISRLCMNLCILFFILVLYKYNDRLYTAVTFILLLVTFIYHRWTVKSNYLTYFFAAWALALLPMMIVNGILTKMPVLIYNDAENSGMRLTTIPAEDFFYHMLYMFWMIWAYEHFQNRRNQRIEKREARKLKRESTLVS